MTPFRAPEKFMKSITAEFAASVLAEANDVCLVVDESGVVRDVAVGSEEPVLQTALSWLGQRWADTVTTESRPKVEALLDAGFTGGESRWRQVNHPIGDETDLPILYKAMPSEDGTHIVVVGRNLRPMSQMQQQLLDVQHSLERDYARLHQAEMRYRMLFNMSAEAILIVDAETRRIVEANPTAGRILDTPPQKLLKRRFPRGFSESATEEIEELLLRVRAAGGAADITVRDDNDAVLQMSATLIRREDGTYFLVRIGTLGGDASSAISQKVLSVVAKSSDAFVMTDASGEIIASNRAFLDLTQIASDMQVIGQPLDRWLGRAGVDANVLLRNLQRRGEIRHYRTSVRPEFGAPIDVDLSAVEAVDGSEECYGFVIRPQIASAKDSKDDKPVLPRSLEEMTELVGRVPLKVLVRDTTDIIERMCIEAALKLTNDSRASAAEMLGLSRQSLYVKLRRYGLEDDSENN
jgi:transcriptional regulator PpsR